MFVTALLYTLSSMMIAAMIVTYAIAYYYSRNRLIIGFVLFLSATLMVSFSASYFYWTGFFGTNSMILPYPSFRTAFLFCATTYLFAQTWKQNGNLRKF